MPGLKIIVPGITFANYVDISDYPVADNLSALFYLGTSAELSIVNRAVGFPNANTPGANVTFGAGFAGFTGAHNTASNYIQTNQFDNASTPLTRIAVYRKLDAVDRGITGIFTGVGDGSGILSGQVFAANGTALSSILTTALAAQPKFNFVAQTYSGTTLTAYRGVAGALVTSGTDTLTRIANSAVGERIGGGVSASSYTGAVNIAAVSKHRSALTALQIAEIYNFFKFYAARTGLLLE